MLCIRESKNFGNLNIMCYVSEPAMRETYIIQE